VCSPTPRHSRDLGCGEAFDHAAANLTFRLGSRKWAREAIDRQDAMVSGSMMNASPGKIAGNFARAVAQRDKVGQVVAAAGVCVLQKPRPSSRAVAAIDFSLLGKLAVASPVRRLGLFL
jgi:hypothetical protein